MNTAEDSVSNASYVCIGQDREGRDFRDTQWPEELSYEETEGEARAKRRRINPEEEGVCHMGGCGRRLPELSTPVFYCCRTCWYTLARSHGPACKARH
eukprot:9104623-Pyramimonas_sp.AAC.1